MLRLFTILLFAAGTSQAGHVPTQKCLALLAGFDGGTTLALEVTRAKQFSLDMVTPEAIEERLGIGVYRIKTPEGPVVLRVSREPGDIEFEQFASAFARSAALPTPAIHKVVTLDQRLRELFLSIEQGKPNTELFVDDLKNEDMPTIKASVAAYFPMETGSGYLNNLAGFDFRKRVWGVSTEVKRSELSPENGLSELKKMWVELEPHVQETIIEDAAKVGMNSNPKTHFEGFVEEALADPALPESLRIAVWDRIPAKIQTQLADQWAIFTVLGISDPHPDNWLIRNERVVPIDLAMYTSFFSRGIEKTTWIAQISPVGGSPNGDLKDKLIESLSPHMTQFLSDLDNSRVKAVASSVNYVRPNEKWIGGMTARAGLLVPAIAK